MSARERSLTVVIADDHPVVLKGLRGLIETDHQFEVVGACADGVTALRLLQAHSPDLAVLDISMPGLTGVEVLRHLRRTNSKTRVVFLTASASDQQIIEAVALDAYGLMLKEAAADDLLECLQSVSAGVRWLPAPLVNLARERERKRKAEADVLETALTTRERELVLLVADGLSNKEIARRIGVTEGTVKIHLHNIYQKLGVTNRTSMVSLALAYRSRS
jgi:two-component system, NarL family, nitrate/nitrite response regulator NarL